MGNRRGTPTSDLKAGGQGGCEEEKIVELGFGGRTGGW